MKSLLNLNIVLEMIANLRNDLNSVKQLSKKELSKVRESINDTGDGQNSLRRNLKSKKRR